MKRKLQVLAVAAVLSTAAVTGGIGCLMSGMLIEGNLLLVAAVAMVTALIGGFCFQRRLSFLPAAVLGALGLALWLLGPLNRSSEYLIWYISSLYDAGYGCGVVRWSQESILHASSTLALCYGASWLSLAVTRSVVKQKRSFLGMVSVLLPLLPCLVLTDTVPKAGWLFITLLCFILLLLTQTVRGRDSAQAVRLMGWLAVPVALALGLLLLLCPRETYTGQLGAEKLEEMIVSWFDIESIADTTPKSPVKLSVAADVSAKEVDLDKVGPQNPGVQVVMQVQAEKTGTLYLRGSAYDCYDGVQWSISQGSWSRDGEFAPSGGKELTLTVTTSETHPILYLAYVPTDPPALQNGRLNNTRGVTEYTVTYVPAMGYQTSWEQLQKSVPGDMQMYLTLPETTLAAAREYLRTSVGLPKENMTAGEMYRYATTVSALVRNSASYDLGTPEMPAGAEDFALWFLKESDTGYCVHYASATAVLLRAAGIPARYVSGYLVNARANDAVNVRHKDAHAWVEYYIPGVGWMMLESTASGGDSPVVVTRPPETEPPTETTILEETTEDTTVQTEQSPMQQEQTTPQPTEETVPQDEIEKQDTSWVGTLILIAVAIAAVLVQWRLRVALRRQSRRRGKPNAQVLRRWQEVALCAWLLKTKPDSRLHALAQKAKFSQEIITPAELRQFDESLKESRSQLKKKPIWNQLLYTLILALY